jgi:hypothetical protein
MARGKARAQYAPVGPLAVYEELERHGALGDYHLLVADEVLRNPKGWHRFYDGLWRQGRSPYVIVDNGLVEIGRPLSLSDLLTAARIVSADCLVLPDMQRDTQASFEMTVDAYREVKRRGVSGGIKAYDTMCVAQGVTEREVHSVAMRLWVATNAPAIAVPRVVGEDLGGRSNITRAILGDLPTTTRVHLLGASRDLVDDIETLQFKGMMGIDTAMPIWLNWIALQSPEHCFDPRIYKATRPHDYWSWKGDKVTQCSIRNVFNFRHWVAGGGHGRVVDNKRPDNTAPGVVSDD